MLFSRSIGVKWLTDVIMTINIINILINIVIQTSIMMSNRKLSRKLKRILITIITIHSLFAILCVLCVAGGRGWRSVVFRLRSMICKYENANFIVCSSSLNQSLIIILYNIILDAYIIIVRTLLSGNFGCFERVGTLFLFQLQPTLHCGYSLLFSCNFKQK